MLFPKKNRNPLWVYGATSPLCDFIDVCGLQADGTYAYVGTLSGDSDNLMRDIHELILTVCPDANLDDIVYDESRINC